MAKSRFTCPYAWVADYEYRQADAFEQLGRALTEAELDVAVILKHQEMPTRQELQCLQKYCPEPLSFLVLRLMYFVDALFKKIEKITIFTASSR